MKYEFKAENDIVTLTYKDKKFEFKTNVKLISELQGLVMEARKRMIIDCSKNGESIKDLSIEIKKNGKTYFDNSNKTELEKIYQEQVTLEYFDNKCIELFGMSLANLMVDIGLDTEDDGAKFSQDLITYLSGNIPRNSTKK